MFRLFPDDMFFELGNTRERLSSMFPETMSFAESNTTRTSEVASFFNADKKGLTCEIDLPGITKDKVHISVQDAHRLLVKVEQVGRRKEQSFSVRIGHDYEIKKASCKMQDGVLMISVPIKAREETSTSFTIPVD